ncbi:hypothetical protein [Thiolinea disciformis]|uniref:hypothetical protein n=1 Tax=Thiolinea disciformis TaxID=125614 RepID=UPI000361BE77|nr:hypothetical protein [Thiolinea disciformis]
MATIAEKKYIEELEALKVSQEKQIAELQAKLVNIDAARPGATATEIAEWERKITDRDNENASLTEQISRYTEQISDLQSQIRVQQQGDAMDEALSSATLDMKAIPSMTGVTAPMNGVDSIRLATFALDVDGGGVVLVTIVNGSPVVSVQRELKLANKALGYTLVRRPEFK